MLNGGGLKAAAEMPKRVVIGRLDEKRVHKLFVQPSPRW
jgi:hypothetical protein